MNNFRRKQLEQAMKLIEQAQCIIAEVANQEQDAFENLPEGLQYSDRGNTLYENANALDDVASELENQMDNIMEII